MIRPFQLLVILMTSTLLPDGAAQPAPPGAGPVLRWERLPDVAGPTGLKGMYGGVSGDRVLLAGGSNFPVPQRTGGRKRFHAAIYVRSIDAKPDVGWTIAAERLPDGRGEGASVTALGGVIAIGGDDGAGPIADVFLLRWNPDPGRVELSALPPLPEPAGNAAAAVLGSWLYVAGGMGRARSLAAFWRLNLDAPATGWETLPSWPGAPRYGGVLVPVNTPSGLHLWWAGGIEGPARSQEDYLRDAYLYQPAPGAWRRVADLPRGAVLGAGLAAGAGRVVLLGGSDGHDFARMKELGAAYRIPGDVLLYDAAEDRWTRAGTMPLGLVGATIVRTGASWLMAGGEYAPGLRTPQVHRLVGEMAERRESGSAHGGAR
jgi:N-acetylneuraminic acid mutarotase